MTTKSESSAESYDCVVLGAGPAGSTVAALVAKAGFSTLLLEREKMPRFHVGESLMPETYWPLQRLGVLDQLKVSDNPKKHSVQFVNETGKASQPFYFKRHDPRECSQTWQVVRSEFDEMLFKNAAAKGADCRDATRVLEVLFTKDTQRATGVRVVSADGATRDIEAKVVVDATGLQSLIATRLGIRRDDPMMRKSSIWTYYRGAVRDTGNDAGATIILHTTGKKSWFWFIPLANDLTSVGVVGDTEYLLKGRDKPPEIFEEELGRCVAMQARLENAQRADDFHVAREFSYKAQEAAGDGWVLVGDAYGFIDPVYSSGVYFALKSGEMAADCIVEGLGRGDNSAAQLGSWADQFDPAVELVRKLVNAFYTTEFSFGQFIKAHPHHLGNLTDLLIGRIFHPNAGSVFRDMDPWLEKVKTPDESA